MQVKEIQINKTKTDDKKQAPTKLKWKGVEMVRNHSFLATIKEIVNWAEEMDRTKIGLVGDPHSGKTTLAESIAHCIHKYSKVPFAVRIFTEEHLLNFKETLNTLATPIPTNYILVFDDVSFMGANANKKQVEMIKRAETKIRHLPGGQDVKIVLIYNYHYTLGLDKYLRQADFNYYTTIGSEETTNMVNHVGKKYTALIENFKRWRVNAVANKYWIARAGPKDPVLYKYRKPFIPVLYWNNRSLRFVITPKREWIDAVCSSCTIGKDLSKEDVVVGDSTLDIIKRGEVNYGRNFQTAVRLELFRNGLVTHNPLVVRAIRYISRAILAGKTTLEEMQKHYDFTVTKTNLRLKPDDPLYNVAKTA